jgi:pimeloyl-ACP methyl ester carboxylesterase
MELAMVQLTHKRASVNGVMLHYVTAGSGPAVLCLHGWPQNHREFRPFFEALSSSYRFIAPDLRGYADSDKPYTDYLPATIAQDMLELANAEGVDRFHILSHDLGGPPSVALAYMAGARALSLATIETPFFGLDYPGYVDPRVAYWHLTLHANMDLARFLIEGREDHYLRHFFRDFAFNPDAVSEEDVSQYATQMEQPGNLRASLNHYAFIPEKSAQLAEFAKNKLTIPVMAWAGRYSFAEHCIDSARSMAPGAEGGVIEECGHWVFEEKTDFIVDQLRSFWAKVRSS